MFTEDKITEIYCIADDFFKLFNDQMKKHVIPDGNILPKRRYHRESIMSQTEVMIIMILFHASGYRCLKHYYLRYVSVNLRHLFPKLVSYNRFVELEKNVALPLAIFIKKVLLGKCTGISIVDSTPLRVCRNQRIQMHRVFKGIAARGKCSMGWFFGFKLHLICNEKGELLNFMFTPGDIDDRRPLEYKPFIRFIYGKLVGDKGYISQNLFERLFVDGIQLITKLKSNMKGALMSVSDRLLLRKRALIETINDELKNIAQIEHSRHRSFDNFLVNLLSGIAAYCFFPKKPAINLQKVTDNQLALF
jgi:hypothetical protein